MYLHCKVCDAKQPVTSADEADEDARTRAIRQAFREEHAVLHGVGSVVFVFPSAVGGLVEAEGLLAWADRIEHPEDVTPTGDGYFTRRIQRDGVPHDVRVCEDCWQIIPRYVDFQFGLVSPESDGDAQGNGAKTRRIVVQGTTIAVASDEHLRKAVCLPCYLAAYRRMYPDAPLPDLRGDVIGDGTPVTAPPPPPEDDFAEEPRVA